MLIEIVCLIMKDMIYDSIYTALIFQNYILWNAIIYHTPIHKPAASSKCKKTGGPLKIFNFIFIPLFSYLEKIHFLFNFY